MAGMTESEWRECICPETMLLHWGDRIGPRKKRLFACACVRRIWPLMPDRRLCRAIRRAERYADGLAAATELQSALQVVIGLREALEQEAETRPNWTALAQRAAAQAVQCALAMKEPRIVSTRDGRPDVVSATRRARTAARAAEVVREANAPPARPRSRPFLRLASMDAADLLREILGNPFRPVVVDPSWLAWNNSTVSRLARAIYDKRRLRQLPVLADALEEAGCTNVEMLAHCRAPQEHVRGCWALDALLGMK